MTLKLQIAYNQIFGPTNFVRTRQVMSEHLSRHMFSRLATNLLQAVQWFGHPLLVVATVVAQAVLGWVAWVGSPVCQQPLHLGEAAMVMVAVVLMAHPRFLLLPPPPLLLPLLLLPPLRQLLHYQIHPEKQQLQ